MTNVPGFIPKPYPIVIFPGTCVIILQKVAVDFFRIKEISPTKNFADFFRRQKRNIGNHLKRVFPKFEAERSHPRGVNGRSKFRRQNFDVEKCNVGNPKRVLWQSLAGFRALFEGVNGDSKIA